MMQEHLSDAQIQEFVLDGDGCQPAIRTHIHQCRQCQAKAAAYKLIIDAIKQQPAPALDFNISELVLAMIETKQQRNKNWWLYFFITGVMSIVGVVIYLFREEISTLFTGTGNFFFYLSAVISLFIAAAVVIDQLQTYKTKMKKIATT